ncbi:GNAT family N-acetyltransferase|nr:GNAT family N-acetyltransferase [Candidatus Pantoea persica]
MNLGNQLMEQALRSCEQHWPAQAHLQAFYGRLGFQTVGDVYLEDNIPHIDMRK